MSSEETKTVESAYKAAIEARKNTVKSRTDYFESVLKDGETLSFKAKTLPEERHIGMVTYWVVVDEKNRAVTLSKISDLEKVFNCIKEEKAFSLKAHLLGEELRFSDRTKRSFYRRIFEYSLVE